MKKEDCFLLGYIQKLHGTQGEVVFHLDVDSPKQYSQLESVFIDINDELVPFFIENISIKNQKAVVKLEDIDSTEQAEDLTGSQLFLPITLLPPLTGNAFYYHEIVGFKVIDKNYGDIGVIKNVIDMPGHPVAQVLNNEQELLMPVTDPFILEVDKQNKLFKVDLPDGLVELYLPNLKPTGK